MGSAEAIAVGLVRASSRSNPPATGCAPAAPAPAAPASTVPAPAAPAPAVPARARLARMLWEVAARTGVLAGGLAVLLSLLIDESPALHLVSAFALAAGSAAAALVLGTMLVALVRLLGIAYDLVRILLPALVGLCIRTAALLIALVRRHRRDVERALARAAGRLIRLARACADWFGQALVAASARIRSWLARAARQAGREALWIKQDAQRLLGKAPVVAGWPIRSTARLILGLIERRARRLPHPAGRRERGQLILSAGTARRGSGPRW